MPGGVCAVDGADSCGILRNRGLAVSDRLPALLACRLAVHGPEALVAAALAGRDEADLLARLDAQRAGHGPAGTS